MMGTPILPWAMSAIGLLLLLYVYFPSLRAIISKGAEQQTGGREVKLDRSVSLQNSSNNGLINTGDIYQKRRAKVLSDSDK